MEKALIKPDFDKRKGLIVVVVQDYSTLEVLMVAYMDKKAYEKTLETGFVHFWSTSKDELWFKGEESGNKLLVKGPVCLDCDRDAILIKVAVKGKGKVCHTGERSCFFNSISFE